MRYLFLLLLIATKVSAQEDLRRFWFQSANNHVAARAQTDYSFNYSLDTSSMTSAGVYALDGTLVRTLWSGVRQTAGLHTYTWDGASDSGMLLMEGNYNVKVLSNNVVYTWDGVVGNTSTASHGPSVHHSFYGPFFGMAFSGNTGYYAAGYNEGHPAEFKFNVGSPNAKAAIFPENKQTDQATYYVATDGTTVYWAGPDSFDPNKNFVFGTNVSNDVQKSFPNGIPLSMGAGGTYPSCIDVVNAPGSDISGIAVQKNGPCLFVAHGGMNQIHVINKSTGALMQTISVANARAITVDAADNLWITSTVTSQVAGSMFGTPGYNLLPVYSFDHAFNGNTQDFYAGRDTICFVGMDMGTPKPMNLLAIYPRTGFKYRIEGSILQGSNVSANDGFVNITTLPASLPELQYNYISVPNTIAYRYYRIYSPGMLDVAEVIFNNQVNQIEKFKVNPDGTLTSANIVVSGFSNPLAIAVSPDNNTVVVADGGVSSQIKAFNNQTGLPLWTFGQSGGYMNDPTVANDKFYFGNTKYFSNEATFISFQPDGTFWVGDQGNYRAQHFSANRTFINNIMNIGFLYSSYVDPITPSRVVANYLEFSVDYTKPLAPDNGSWKLVKNWGIKADRDHDDNFNRLRSVTTFPNGRVYALSRNSIFHTWDIVELPATGNLRFTGVRTPNINYNLYPDGSLWVLDDNSIGAISSWQKMPLSGFDASGNPQYGAQVIIASSPPVTASDPITEGGSSLYSGQITSSGIVVAFSSDALKPNGMGSGYHLGGIKAGGNKWLWKAAPATKPGYTGDFPSDGSFDISNGVVYAGGFAQALDRSIFWNYHGEFWKASQTNKWNHYYDNGLFVGQFGTTGPDGDEEAAAGMAGNTFSGGIVKDANGDMYVYHCDEGYHGGVHRWKITSLNTIREQSIPVVLGFRGQGLNAQFYSGIYLNNFNLRTTVAVPKVGLTTLPPEITANSAFSTRWSGFLKADFSENYTIFAKADEKIRVWLSDTLIIDSWNNTSVNEYSSVPKGLKSGVRYPLRVEYANAASSSSASLMWSSPNLPKQEVATTNLYPPINTGTEGIDLMEGLAGNAPLQTSMYGWDITPGMGIAKGTQTSSGRIPDILASFWATSGSESLTRNLTSANVDLNQWTLAGKIVYPLMDADWGDGGAGYFEILDNNYKIIARISRTLIASDIWRIAVYGNGKKITYTDARLVERTLRKMQSLAITAGTDGSITIKLGDYPPVTTASTYDPSANWKRPKSMRIYFRLVGGNGQGHITSISKMRFYPNVPPPQNSINQ